MSGFANKMTNKVTPKARNIMIDTSKQILDLPDRRNFDGDFAWLEDSSICNFDVSGVGEVPSGNISAIYLFRWDKMISMNKEISTFD